MTILSVFDWDLYSYLVLFLCEMRINQKFFNFIYNLLIISSI